MLPLYVSNICGEFGDVCQVPLLSRGPRIADFSNREGQRLVVRVKREGAAFEEIPKVTNGQIHYS